MPSSSHKLSLAAAVMGILVFAAPGAFAEGRSITLASGTSPNDSGLLPHILPQFEEATGIRVEVIATSSREALEMTSQGHVDAVLAHLPSYERRIMDDRIGQRQETVMSTHYVIAGPPDDPADVRAAESATEAIERIFAERQLFLSRGDESGTHTREMRLWDQTSVSNEDRSFGWYQQTLTGMADTINGAGAVGAYTLVDYPNWLRFGTGGGLRINYQDPEDRLLHDIYSIIVLNPDQVEGVDADGANELADWLVSAEGQEAIRQFQIAGEYAYRPLNR